MIFDFIKDAGEAVSKSVGGIADRITGNAKGVEDLKVEENGDTIVLTGKAATQKDAELAVLSAGNTPGVAKVDSRIEVANAEPAATFYTVKSGDSLWNIAEALLGNGSKYQAIFEANRPMLSDPDKIYPGQSLRIPPQS